MLMHSLLQRSVLLFIGLLFALPAFADKTDVVFLKNGDRVTGEVKNMERGILEFKTDFMGTLYIEWENILQLVSNTGQSVELANGQRFYGALDKPENEEMVRVNTQQGTVGVSTLDVVSMYPVAAGFWERLDMNARLGFSWDKGSNVGKYSLGFDAQYRDPKFVTKAGFSAEITTQKGRDNSRRMNLNANHLIFKQNKKYLGYFGTVERNDELGLDFRALLGAGYGWVPIRSNRNWFSIGAGLDVNREKPNEGEQETNLEAVAMMTFEYFVYSSPERKFRTNLMVFPSLTDFGRWRAELDTDFRLELFSDLFWVLEFYASFDSAPISPNASNSDYGIINSLSYKF